MYLRVSTDLKVLWFSFVPHLGFWQDQQKNTICNKISDFYLISSVDKFLQQNLYRYQFYMWNNIILSFRVFSQIAFEEKKSLLLIQKWWKIVTFLIKLYFKCFTIMYLNNWKVNGEQSLTIWTITVNNRILNSYFILKYYKFCAYICKSVKHITSSLSC